MGMLIAKSKENLISAQLLIENKYYASSVHCSYYSSVQLMIHLLITKFNFTQEKLENEAIKEGKGSHVFAINQITKHLKSKQEILKSVDFYRNIGKLKTKRKHADYLDTLIDKPYSDEALLQANEINGILTTAFNIIL